MPYAIGQKAAGSLAVLDPSGHLEEEKVAGVTHSGNRTQTTRFRSASLGANSTPTSGLRLGGRIGRRSLRGTLQSDHGGLGHREQPAY